MTPTLQTIAEPQHRLTSEDLTILKQIQRNLRQDLDRVGKELSRWKDYYFELFTIESIDFDNNIVYVSDYNDQEFTIPLEVFTYSDSELHKYVDEQIQVEEKTKKWYQERSKERRRKQYEKLKKEFESS